jgi:hypothetical protein
MKVVRFKAGTGIGMYDPITINFVLENGEEITRNYDGRSSLSPKQFLENDGYQVDCDINDWEWNS